MRRIFVLCISVLLCILPALAQETPNAQQARRIFNIAYNKVFGEQGATLHYDVNITGIYKTSGTIWYKGKMSKFQEAKMDSWNDGQTVYAVRKKKREVDIYSAKNNKADKYSEKFAFHQEQYDYSIAADPDGLLITLRAKRGTKGMKEIRALVDRHTYAPIRLRIKVAFIWTTVKVSDFRSGGITDEMLRFPSENYKDYKFTDHRGDKHKK